MKQKLFTKSAFKIALDCPNKLYYYRNPDVYANADAEDEFLQALAEGGFQVGELAKIYCDVPPENDIEELDYDTSLRRTQELMQQECVNIAEAAFKFGNLFVRVDVLKRVGNVIDLIEVKAKSWDPDGDKFINDNGCVVTKIRPYVYDVAFQKYVVTHALRELYPKSQFTVRTRLMMADKSKTADINGMNQLFKIKEVNHRTRVETAPNAHQLLAQSNARVLTAFDVDELCDRVIAGKTSEQGTEDFMLNMKFIDYVETMSKYYCDNKPFPDITLGSKCFKCQFQNDDSTSELKDGYKECWKNEKTARFDDSDFDEPLVKDLWRQYIRCDKWIQEGIYKMEDITEEQLPRHDKNKSDPWLDHYERKWLQIAMMTDNQEVLSDFASDIRDGVYLDVDGLRAEMAKWKFPLHMIDFETTAVALPYYEGMRPYEQVAFQFSHHIIEKGGEGGYTIRHAGQYLNEDVTKFPNFEFVRALRNQLSNDDGTIFRYAPHENTILRAIYKQLDESHEGDKQELMEFIDSITHLKDKKTHKLLHQGPRDMLDLWDVVKRYFYEPGEMRGRTSIKVVLPAVLNVSQFLKNKYSKPIYGKVIPSCNISASDPIAWIEIDAATGHVENPYHLLPPVKDLIGIDIIDNEMLESMGEDMTIANGGAALTAYNKLMFCDGNMTDALREALLRYCELDTMAMVFIWEYFNQQV
ncbi:MAG: DUF2779 domain-containing protein [Muribaculaceae bacterium]|nr:DUF2779 domain-containing protein [Muribaculaceae bacterium]